MNGAAAFFFDLASQTQITQVPSVHPAPYFSNRLRQIVWLFRFASFHIS